MKVRFTLSALLAAMAALMLAFASPALAKNGGGGGGGGGTTADAPVTSGIANFRLPTADQLDSNPCATITSWTPSVQTYPVGDLVVLDVGVRNDCPLDEHKTSSMGLTVTDTATGDFVFRSVIGAGLRDSIYRYTLGSVTSLSPTTPARSLYFDVYKSNGKLEAFRTASLAEVVQAALSAQPAA